MWLFRHPSSHKSPIGHRCTRVSLTVTDNDFGVSLSPAYLVLLCQVLVFVDVKGVLVAEADNRLHLRDLPRRRRCHPSHRRTGLVHFLQIGSENHQNVHTLHFENN